MTECSTAWGVELCGGGGGGGGELKMRLCALECADNNLAMLLFCFLRNR